MCAPTASCWLVTASKSRPSVGEIGTNPGWYVHVYTTNACSVIPCRPTSWKKHRPCKPALEHCWYLWVWVHVTWARSECYVRLNLIIHVTCVIYSLLTTLGVIPDECVAICFCDVFCTCNYVSLRQAQCKVCFIYYDRFLLCIILKFTKC